MARSRNIKPAFFLNDTLAEIDPLGRLLFIGMWTICDFKGDFEWRERRIKVQILPYDNCDIKELAINLDKSGLIRFYSNGEKVYVNTPNFAKHQNPHKNERGRGSDVPPFSEGGRQLIDLETLAINRDSNGINQDDSHSDRADSLLLIPDSCKEHTSDSDESPACLQKDKPEEYFKSSDLKAEWMAFKKMRRQIKKPINDVALTRLIAKHKKLVSEGSDPAEIINRSTESCWASFYEVKNGNQKTRELSPAEEYELRTQREDEYISKINGGDVGGDGKIISPAVDEEQRGRGRQSIL